MTSQSVKSPPRLRLGYLVSKYPAVSHTFILREVLALRERGFEIEVASINDPPPRPEMTAVEQAEADRTLYVKRAGAVGLLLALLWMLLHHPLGLLRGLGAAIRLGGSDLRRILLCLFYYAEAAILARWAAAKAISHLHVHFATPAATVAMILTKMAPVTLSMTVHGPDEFYDVPGYYLAEKIAASRFVVCISFFAQSQLMKLSPQESWDKFDIARLGVDPGHFAPRPARIASDPFEVVCVGRIVSTKGQRILIDAVEQLVRAGRHIQLRLIGDGPDRLTLETLVQQRNLTGQIFFEGSINQDRLRSYYNAADAFALATFAEGIPVVLMEAMSMEIPCVSSAINGIPELIENGVTGLLVPPSDVDGVAAALARLMDDPALRDSIGKAGRHRVQQAYNLDRSADRLAEVFDSRLGGAA